MKPTEDILKLPLSERARLAGEAAIDDVIETHRRAGVPIAFLRDGKVVEMSADEYAAHRAAKRKVQVTGGNETMSDPISRRAFTATAAGLALGAAANTAAGDDKPKADKPPAAAGPTEAAFERDYAAPSFKPSWKKPQIHRQFVQDFVIYAHSDLAMVKKLLDKEPALLNAAMDWGAGDWETGLGGASHMGRRDIVEVLLERGARIDLFCAAMMGQLDAVKSFLTLQPKLIDAKGPHGFTLHFHAQVGGKEAEPVLDYLQSIKKIELKPNPFLKK